jgi:hypothetical protein
MSMTRKLFANGFRWLASLQVAVVLIVVLAAVLAVATVLEVSQGSQYVRWFVYNSRWFCVLLALLGANVLAATLIRFPWRKSQIGFVVTHAGLLVLLVGAVQTFDDGIEGRIAFQQGQTENKIVLTDRNQLRAAWSTPPGKSRPPAAVFGFTPGPVDWREEKVLDLGEVEGVYLRVLKYYCHARTIEDWDAAGSEDGIAAIKFCFAGPDAIAIREDWLVEDQFGPALNLGPTRFALYRVQADSMLDDFANPPSAQEMDKNGLLTVHYQGKSQRIAVGENVGKKVSLGDSGISVEIAEYLPNARPGAMGRFTSQGDDPKNPMLELRVYLPGKEEPMRQIAFAKFPFLNLDAIYRHICPVKFWYHHPAVWADSAVEFLQTPDGKLHCRVATAGKYQSRGVLAEGEAVEIPGKFTFTVVKSLPHAIQNVTFEPVKSPRGDNSALEPAALVEVTAAGKTQHAWLKRNDPSYQTQSIATPKGDLLLSFGYDTMPLDFSLTLLSFKHGVNPGRMGDASFASSVRLVDKPRGVDEEREISMNRPLQYNKYRFYQSSYSEVPGQPSVSILAAAYDPGRFLKYLGSLMLCGGMSLTFAMLALRRKKTSL